MERVACAQRHQGPTVAHSRCCAGQPSNLALAPRQQRQAPPHTGPVHLPVRTGRRVGAECRRQRHADEC